MPEGKLSVAWRFFLCKGGPQAFWSQKPSGTQEASWKRLSSFQGVWLSQIFGDGQSASLDCIPGIPLENQNARVCFVNGVTDTSKCGSCIQALGTASPEVYLPFTPLVGFGLACLLFLIQIHWGGAAAGRNCLFGAQMFGLNVVFHRKYV